MLFWLIEFYLITLFTMYKVWGRIVYQTDGLDLFEGSGGVVYGLALFCVIIASLAMVQEVAFNLGEEYDKDCYKQDNLKCPFIHSLKKLPATQTKMAVEGMTLRRLKPFSNDPMMLFRVLESAGIPPADCLDVMAELKEFIKDKPDIQSEGFGGFGQ